MKEAMNKYFSFSYLKVGTIIIAVVSLAMVGTVFPRALEKTKAEDCANVTQIPSIATFNPFAVSWSGNGGTNCMDQPTLSVAKTGSNSFAPSISAQNGDQIAVSAYIHNGARQDLGSADIAKNVQVNFNVDTTVGGSHTITVTLTGQNVNGGSMASKSGSVTINTPAGSSLQVVSGSGLILDHLSSIIGSAPVGNSNFTVNLGDINACFEFSKFVDFKVLVVGGQATVPSGKISGTVGSQIGNQCLFNGYITWSTTNVTTAVVNVIDYDTGAVKTFSENLNGSNVSAPWIQPGKNAVFILYDTSNGAKTELDRTSLTTTATCGGTPPVTGQFNITFNCGTVTWTSPSNVISVDVVWQDITTHTVSKSLPNTSPNGSATVGPLTAGSVYYFIIYNTTNGAHTNAFEKTTSIYDPAACGVTPPPATLYCKASGSSYNISDSVAFTATGGKGSYSWSSVGGNPNSGSGSVFSTSYSTSGNKTAVVTSSDGQTASCGTYINSTPVNTTLTCFAGNSSYNIGDTVIYLASGGKAPYSWSSVGGNPNSGSGTVFNPSYSTGGTKTAIVTSGDGQTASCSTIIKTPIVPKTLTCVAGSSSYNIGDTVIFTATGSTGSYTWTTVGGGTPINGTGSVFSTSYSTSGNKTAYVVGSDGQTASCSTSINQTPVSTATINLVKLVKNITKGDSGYFHSTNAVQGDTVQYQISVSSASANALTNVLVTDTFATGLTYVDGSLTVNGQTHATGLSGSGLSFSSVGQSPVVISYQATVAVNSGSIINTARATAENASGSASDQAVVNVTSQPVIPPANTGNCNNSDSSCNHNTNNNTQNSSGNNSANQNNGNNINGNNNTVTNTNNNCVNNSCNYSVVYITSAGNTVPANQFSQLSITKMVRNYNGGSYGNSVSVNSGDSVQFEITVTNTGSATANNVRVTDSLPGGLTLVSGSVLVNGSYATDNNLTSGMYLGSLTAGQSERIDFQARTYNNNGSSIQNVANATSDNAGSVQASAWVFINSSNNNVLGSSVNLAYNKKAWNETKNADATSVIASKEDYITYTLTATNNGNVSADNFIITDDLSQVLPYADVSDNGGGYLSGNVISFPAISVPAYGSVSKSFKVRVKYSLADNLGYVMTNTYGNTIIVKINSPAVLGAFVAPKTGADTNAFAFAGLLTAASAIAMKRKALFQLIFS